MDDEEIRYFMAQLLAKLFTIEDKVTRLYDQTDAARWERIRQEPQAPARQLTDEEYHQLTVQRFRDETPPAY